MPPRTSDKSPTPAPEAASDKSLAVPPDPAVATQATATQAPATQVTATRAKTPPLVLVIFGASGDLASRKILPALANLADRGRLSERFSVIGVARTAWSDEEFQKVALEAAPGAGAQWKELVKRFRYVSGEYAATETFDRVKVCLAEADQAWGTEGNRVYYLATVPAVFSMVATALEREGCNVPGEGGSFARLVVEKPYGHDLDSAIQLDADVHSAFKEEQIFRIDHYMGKETVQNLLALRFANAIFEPIWNRRYVERIQITVAESLGVEHRGGFYETAGALRDIVQNHVMQVLALTLMEPPTGMDADRLRDEKVKLLKSVEIPTPDEAVDLAVRGQYGAGEIDGVKVCAYRDEDGVSPTSLTETFAALRLNVENWRWAGVPIYVRTGKRLKARVTEVGLRFHQVPFLAFRKELARELEPDTLVLRIQPDEGISLHFGAKVPGEEFRVQSVAMEFLYDATFRDARESDGYPRLLHDAMCGDATLFIRTDEVDQAWRIVDPYLEAWSAAPSEPPHPYAAGSWGPHASDLLLARSGDSWRAPDL